jgi:hypothetical protein
MSDAAYWCGVVVGLVVYTLGMVRLARIARDYADAVRAAAVREYLSMTKTPSPPKR